MNKKLLKIKKDKFKDALANELMSAREFSEIAGTCETYLSQLASNSKTSKQCTPSRAKRILNAFDNKYKLQDLFYWV